MTPPSDDIQRKPFAETDEPQPGAGPEPDAAADGAATDAPDVAAAQEPAAKRSVLVTVSDCVCAALASATSVR